MRLQRADLSTGASLLGLAIVVLLETIRNSALSALASPGLMLALGLVGSIAVTFGVWNLPTRPIWRVIVGLLGGIAIITLLIPAVWVAARMVRDSFPLASQGVFAAPIVMLWFGVVVLGVLRSGSRQGSGEDDG